LLRSLDSAAGRSGDPALQKLVAEIESFDHIPPRGTWSNPSIEHVSRPVMTWNVTLEGRHLSLYTIMTTLGTPLDVTLAEMTIEMFFPADEETKVALTQWAA
jgi:MmyB-like transcription regulator ligand binding domain